MIITESTSEVWLMHSTKSRSLIYDRYPAICLYQIYL
jgi:RNA-binding protein 39